MNQRNYMEVQGTIVAIEPTRMGQNRAQGCMMYVTLEDMDGNIVNFMVTPMTYVLDFAILQEGMQVSMYYRTDAPAPLIYPPQYNAAVVIPDSMGVNVDVGYYNNMLVNESQSLQLNLNNNVPVLTTNNQRFFGSPANHDLVVVYSTSTRSIPAQTTPDKVVVLCNGMSGGMMNNNHNNQNNNQNNQNNQNRPGTPNWQNILTIGGIQRFPSNRQGMSDMPGMNNLSDM